jgi:hypothetical protein
MIRRVSSDGCYAELLYNLLQDEGVSVWWDQQSLKPGEPWEVFIYLCIYKYIHICEGVREEFVFMYLCIYVFINMGGLVSGGINRA